MRIFAYIFSIYLLALSAVPCRDIYKICPNNTIIKELSQSQNHEANRDDACSPFCTCSCCNLSANPKFTFLKIEITKLIVVSKITFPIQDFSFVSNYYGNIWQPPKMNA
ncbi:MAG: hypothetical protein PW786_11295 [Arachidicoccus sp.]|nr:hypothetical protein [Arachidicoccus sp.]